MDIGARQRQLIDDNIYSMVFELFLCKITR